MIYNEKQKRKELQEGEFYNLTIVQGGFKVKSNIVFKCLNNYSVQTGQDTENLKTVITDYDIEILMSDNFTFYTPGKIFKINSNHVNRRSGHLTHIKENKPNKLDTNDNNINS